ncbi:MAG: hypothetical protein M1838_005553, partial [Thelocarpon superellum]
MSDPADGLDCEPTPDGAAAPPLDPATKKARKQNPQKTIDDFWSKFNAKAPGQVLTILPNDFYAKRNLNNAPKGIIPGHDVAASFDEAVATCKAKVEKIATECRRINQKYRDVHFDIDIDLKMRSFYCLNGLLADDRAPPASVKRVGDIFEDPSFFVDGTSADDVKQGRDGDCWFLAALCTLSNMKESDLISRICVARDEKVGVYGFVFYRDGEWTSTIIDDKLYLLKPDYDDLSYDRIEWDQQGRDDGEEKYRKTKQTGSEALYFAQCKDQNETWLPLLEKVCCAESSDLGLADRRKAYAKAHGDYSAIDGGFVGEAIEDLTGGVTTELFTTDILDKDKFWSDEIMNVNRDFLFGCFTGLFGGWGERKGIIEGHAYSIMQAREEDGKKLVLLKNPWGRSEWTGPWSDGSKEWTPYWMEKLGHRFGDDGAFWIEYHDLLRKYQHFDRTRLFRAEDDWTITQQWTSLSIPWSIDYHDTKFTIELKEKSPTVIVLSQVWPGIPLLNDRYFQGLEGQYDFELQFRLHREGEEDYIVRSHGGYLMTRSVSSEIELDPGRYSVLIKVVGVRDSAKERPEEVVRKTCKDKREKLLQIGLSYDLAHAKGQVKESEEDRKKREEKEAKAKAKAKAKAEKQKAREKRKKLKEKEKARRTKEKERKKKRKERERKRKEKAQARLKAQEAEKATKTKAETKTEMVDGEAATVTEATPGKAETNGTPEKAEDAITKAADEASSTVNKNATETTPATTTTATTTEAQTDTDAPKTKGTDPANAEATQTADDDSDSDISDTESESESDDDQS